MFKLSSLKTFPLFVAISAVFIYCLREYSQGCVCQSRARLDGKVVIITGANTGLGKETAIDLARRGGKIYMTSRFLERGEVARQEVLSASGVDPSLVQVLRLDLASLQAVRDFVYEFKARESQLHILINNAGVGAIDVPRTVDGFQGIIGVNHLGHFLLTNLLMDLLIASQPSRVVNLSSLMHMLPGSVDWEMVFYDEARADTKIFVNAYRYGVSKLANVQFTAELARRLQGTSVTTYAVHPGYIATNISANALLSPYLKKVLQLLTWPIRKTVEQGAQTQICCAVDGRVAHESGKYYSDCTSETLWSAEQSVEAAAQLWKISLDLVKLKHHEIHPQLRDVK